MPELILCLLPLPIIIAFAILYLKARRKRTLPKTELWQLAITGTLLSALVGFLAFLGSLLLGIINTPKWPFSSEGAPAWVDPLTRISPFIGIAIFLSCSLLLWRFLRKKIPHSASPN